MVKCDSKSTVFIKVNYKFDGKDLKTFVPLTLINAFDGNVPTAFEHHMCLPATYITNYNTEDLYDDHGNLL